MRAAHRQRAAANYNFRQGVISPGYLLSRVESYNNVCSDGRTLPLSCHLRVCTRAARLRYTHTHSLLARVGFSATLVPHKRIPPPCHHRTTARLSLAFYSTYSRACFFRRRLYGWLCCRLPPRAENRGKWICKGKHNIVPILDSVPCGRPTGQGFKRARVCLCAYVCALDFREPGLLRRNTPGIIALHSRNIRRWAGRAVLSRR